MYYRKRYKLWLIAFIQVAFLTATTYGWPDLQQMLEREGYWIYDGVIDSNYDLVFTLGTWFNESGRLVMGVYLDRFGIQKTAMIGCILSCVGIGLLAFSNTGMNLVYPAFILMSWGGPVVLLATQKVGNLFANKGMVVSSLLWASSISTLGFTFCNVLSEYNVNDDLLYVCYATIAGCFAIQCYFVYPKHFDIGRLKDERNSSSFSRESILITSGRYDEDFLENCTAWEVMSSLDFIMLVMYKSFYTLYLQYYMMTIGDQTENMVGEDMAIEFTICFATVSIVAAGMGYFMDKWGFGILVLCNVGFTDGALMFLSSTTKQLQIVGFVFYVISRMSIYSYFFSFISINFGFNHWGTLAGVGLFVSAIFSLLQYLLAYIVEHDLSDEYPPMNMFLAVWCSVWGGLYAIFLLWMEFILPIGSSRLKVKSGTDDKYVINTIGVMS